MKKFLLNLLVTLSLVSPVFAKSDNNKSKPLNQIQKNQQNSKILSSKEKKLVRKKISNIVSKNNSNSAQKVKFTPKNINILIDKGYKLQIELDEKICNQILEGFCTYRDFPTQENPIFHPTKIVILFDKALAFQTINNSNKIVKIKDGKYEFKTINHNLISFDTKNGKINDLKLISGDLRKEQKESSQCSINQFIYDFYKQYQDGIKILDGIFVDKYNFSAISEFEVILSPENKNRYIVASSRTSNQNYQVLKDIKLCHFYNDKEKYYIKYISEENCIYSQSPQECDQLKLCHDFIEVNSCEPVFLSEEFS